MFLHNLLVPKPFLSFAGDGGAGAGDKGGGAGDGGAKGGEDMVPKTELDKITAEHEKTKKELDEARLVTLSPEYLEFQEYKQGKGKRPPADDDKGKATEVDGTELESMSRKKFATLITDNVVKNIMAELEPHVKKLNATSQMAEKLAAQMEVNKCAAKYKDFWDFKDDMYKLVNANTNLSVEEAYKLAKQNKKIAKDEDEAKAAAAAASEKPGGTAASTAIPKDFKTTQEANDDAWGKVVGDKAEL